NVARERRLSHATDILTSSLWSIQPKLGILTSNRGWRRMARDAATRPVPRLAGLTRPREVSPENNAETIFIVEDYYSYGVKILRTEKSSTTMGSDAAGRGVRRGRACQQAAASARSTSAAWPAAACLYPVPAHRCTASGSPAAAAALRIGLVRWCRAGYPDGA